MATTLVVNFHSLELEFRKGFILARISNMAERVVLVVDLASGLLPNGQPEVCHSDDLEQVTFTWASFGRLLITHVKHITGFEYRFDWERNKPSGILQDSVQMQGAHWYGAAQLRRQHWPIKQWGRPEAAYVTGDSFKDDYGGVMERYWLSSNGVALFVDFDVPLFVRMNDKEPNILSLSAKWVSPYRNVNNVMTVLSYRVFVADDVRRVHELATSHVFSKPEAIPDEMIFRFPIWSTWARYKKNISQDVVMNFARDIKNNGFKAAQVEIDDDWTKRYGDHDFDTDKFPNAKQMIDDIKQLGFRVTIWIHPFASLLSKAASEDVWIKSGFLPGYTVWWNGVGKLLDVTNPEAVSFFKRSMAQLREKYGITSFKFDAGEVNWLPMHATAKNQWSNPNEYSMKYAQMCYECDMEMHAQEVRIGCGTQHLPIFVRMMDKDSKWGFDNGLKSLIPHALTVSILGYPFLLPDMIGGNAYAKFGGIGTSSVLPEKELFIRWLQANVFLPSLQFSLCPWQYNDPGVLAISKQMTELHEQFADTFIALAHESVRSGAPIVRPMWWLAPNDERALIIDDQFLVGDDIVVAPILIRGAKCRDVYLPPGNWNDILRGKVFQGSKVYTNYEASLAELPYFTRVCGEEVVNAAEEEDKEVGQAAGKVAQTAEEVGQTAEEAGQAAESQGAVAAAETATEGVPVCDGSWEGVTAAGDAVAADIVSAAATADPSLPESR